MDNFEEKLVLKEFIYDQFGADSFDDFRESIKDAKEGFGHDGRSEFYEKLIASDKLEIKQEILEKLQDYDENIQEYERKLNRNRDEDITLKYFQYLSLLFSEIYLHWYFKEEDKLWLEFSDFVEKRRNELNTKDLYSAAKDNLSKIAYWMATGSGKTLIMHANYWQFKKYSNSNVENTLLITPNENLTKQHLEELKASGINAARFRPENSQDVDIDISVLDIYKLKEESGEKTYSVNMFEGNNLVFVDEGHKGAQGDTWIKHREQVIGDKGFSFEYSATFGQALNSIDNEMLQNRYVQSIIFEYSFRNFHQDGFAKDYDIQNLEDTDEDTRKKYMTANLLSFYEQKKYFEENKEELEDFNLEKPLWVFVGQTVNATGRDVSKKSKASDVEKIVNFLDRFLEQKEEVTAEISDILSGSDEFLDEEGKNLFGDRFDYLRELDLSAEEIYLEILEKVFNSQTNSSLIAERLKKEDEEIGLKVGGGGDYFGVVNIGSPKKFTDRIEENSNIKVEEQEFQGSLFDNINSKDSNINILMGAKKFTEGWDSYRVSSLGLMNVGKSEGSEIIQIFGRGIRLKGLNRSLKRTSALDIPKNKVPDYIKILESLNVFGIKAGYIKKFEDKLEDENIPTDFVERKIKTDVNSELLEDDLKLPRLKESIDYNNEVVEILKISENYKPTVDLYPKIRHIRSDGSNQLGVEKNYIDKENEEFRLDLVDWDKIFVDIIEYKENTGFSNLIVPKNKIRKIFEEENFTLKYPESKLKGKNIIDKKESIERIVKIVAKKYIEKYYKKNKSDWEDKRRELKILKEDDEALNFDLKFKIPIDEEDLIEEIENILEKLGSGEYSIRFERSIYQPLFVKRKFKKDYEKLSVPAQALNKNEERLVERLKEMCNEEKLDKNSVYLLRNPRRRGIGFSEGGYPDFILWVTTQNQQKIIFLDPHGFVHENDPFKVDKVNLHERVKKIEEDLDQGNIEISSYVISVTDLETLDKNKADLEDKNIYIQEEGYLEKILEDAGIALET